jgi:hypothetical protein
MDNVKINLRLTNGYGNTKKFPSNEIERDIVIRAIQKRIRKANRNIAINANTWIGDEHGVPQPSIRSNMGIK